MNRPKIILDCDPGLDDAFAILTAARYCDLVAITSVNGNVGIDKTTHNALLMTQVGDLDVPVYRGAARPLVEPVFSAAEFHGDSGLGGPDLPALTRQVADGDAVTALLDLTADGDVAVCPVGPLTNIAQAMIRDPTFATRVPEISLMGGSATFGNATAVAEFNIYADPHAAALVFASGARIKMLGLNLTYQVRMGAQEEAELRQADTTTSMFCADLLQYYTGFYREVWGAERSAMHDPCAVLAISHPELFTFESRNVVVETQGVFTKGMTVVDQRARPEPPNAEVAMVAEAEAVIELIMAAATDPHGSTVS